MAAANTDKFMEVGDPGTATTLSAPGYSATDTSINVGSTTGWPSATGVVFAIDTAEVIDGEEVQVAGTYNEFIGTVTDGTTIDNVDWVRGAGDTDYSAGSLTRVYIPVSAERENRLAQGMYAEHKQLDGSHSDITADSIVVADGGTLDVDTINEATAANGVSIDGFAVKDGLVVGGSGTGVSNAGLDTTAGELGGAWKSWTPTLSGITQVSGTIERAVYTQIGKTVHAYFEYTYKTGDTMGNGTISLPVTAVTDVTAARLHIGQAVFHDASGNQYTGAVRLESTTTARPFAHNNSGAYTYLSAINNATIPFGGAWLNNDKLLMYFSYEAA